MRINIDLPDELLYRARARAALDGLKLKDLIALYVEEGLKKVPFQTPPRRRQRSEIPVVRARTGCVLPDLNPVEVQRVLDEEEVADCQPD